MLFRRVLITGILVSSVFIPAFAQADVLAVRADGKAIEIPIETSPDGEAVPSSQLFQALEAALTKPAARGTGNLSELQFATLRAFIAQIFSYDELDQAETFTSARVDTDGLKLKPIDLKLPLSAGKRPVSRPITAYFDHFFMPTSLLFQDLF